MHNHQKHIQSNPILARKQKYILSQVCPGPHSILKAAQSQLATYPTIVSCFPQMKPENRAESEQSGDRQSQRELTRTEGSSNKALELTEDEKVLMNLLKANSPMDLNEIKGQTGLSNKKWDKGIKGLTNNRLARVEKTDEGLFVSLV